MTLDGVVLVLIWAIAVLTIAVVFHIVDHRHSH